MKEIIIDTVLDSLKLIPFLFVAFLIIELFEHKLSDKSKKVISKSGKFGPLIGGALGAFPQCGFSVLATNLYLTRIITLGTLISVYLSTSDEMLPILISENADATLIIKILGIKIFIGMLSGFIIDYFERNNKSKINYIICNDEHCHCESGILKSTIIHTVNTILFIFFISLVLNSVIEFYGEEYLSKIFLKNSIFGPFIASLIGLIPNCASSVVITELYLNNAINFGSMISGLLTGSGVALLVLLKSNHHMRENLKIISYVYLIGVISGIIIELIF